MCPSAMTSIALPATRRGSEHTARCQDGVSHAGCSVVSVVKASSIQCFEVFSARQRAREWLVWWTDCLNRSPSARGVAV